MRRRLVVLALILVAASVNGAAQLRQTPRDSNPTVHVYDPAKLKITESTVPDRNSPTGEVTIWRVVTDRGLILGTLSTKADAELALDAAKKFTAMVIVGSVGSQRTFTYFDR